jgi:glycosyltransferase involved in cell wall biosynthesis
MALHIALLSWVPPHCVGGVESFLRLLAGRLLHSGITVTFVSPPGETGVSSIPGVGTWSHRALLRSDVVDPMLVNEFVHDWSAFLSHERVSLVHSHNLHIPMAPGIAQVIDSTLRSQSVPHVLTVHDATEYRDAHRELAQLRHAIVATQSGYNERRILETSGRIAEYLPVGVDFERYEASPHCGLRTVAAIGRLTAAKGIREVLSDLACVTSSHSPMAVILSDRGRPAVGRSDAYIRELEAIARRTSGLTLEFLNGDDPVPYAYERAALTIVRPNAPEGFGLVALESLASGRPVVARPTGGMTEWISGLSGVYSVAGNCGIAEGVLAVLRDWPRWYAGALLARDTLRPRFDAAVVEREHRRLYRRLTGE